MTTFSHRPFSCRLLTTPIFPLVYLVFFLNSATKNNFIPISPPPLDGVTRGGPPPPSGAADSLAVLVFVNVREYLKLLIFVICAYSFYA